MSQIILYDEESYKIIGAALEVHKILGCGFKEKVYQDAFEIELKRMNIPYIREKHLTIDYKGVQIDHDYFADFLCYDKIIVELKAASAIVDEHISQTVNYLKASNFKVGLLINFGEKSLKHKRILNHNPKTL